MTFRLFFVCAGALLAVCAGGTRFLTARDVAERALALGVSGRVVRLSGTVLAAKDEDERIVAVLGGCRIAGGQMDGADPGRVQVYLGRDLPGVSELCIGNQILVSGEITAFDRARNPGEFDYRLYYRAQKMNYRMTADRFELRNRRTSYIKEGLRRTSYAASMLLGRITDEPDTGIYRAVLLGDKADLDGEIRELYQRNGIAHLLAISGLHLSLIGMTAYGIFRRLGAGFGRAGLLGAAVITAYAVMTGASASVVRASAMLLCGFAAAYLGRTYDLLSALGLSALLLLWDSPYLVTQAGFQLSFGAVFAIGWVSPQIERYLELDDRPKAFKGLAASVSIQFVTGPVILYHYFQFPLYGILLNLAVIPLMAYVVGSGLAGLALGMWSLTAGRFAAGMGHGVLAFYQLLCTWCERLPASNVVAGRPEVWRIELYVAGLSALLLVMNRGWPKRRFLAAPAFAVLAALLVVPLPAQGLTVTFLDVGQGDGIVLRTNDYTVLVDGGSTDEKQLGKYRLEPFLKCRAAVRIDYAFVSHGDQDHISGLLYLLRESKDIRIDHLMLPALGREDEAYGPLCSLVAEQGGTVHWIRRGDRLDLGELALTCIYPGEEDTAEDRNEQSQVLKVDYREFHLLLTGDMSGRGEQALLADPRMRPLLAEVQVLKLAHHGSRFSSTEEWLDAVRPDLAVVSYGQDNSYGHPHREVLERIAARRIRLYRTAENGAVIFWTDGKRLQIKTVLS